MRNLVSAPLLFGLISCALLLGGCAGFMRVMNPEEAQIRERIASIRIAILAKNVEGVFRWGTPDWRFKAPDGKIYDRDAYRERTTKLFAAIEIESLETEVFRVSIQDAHAEVGLNQTMVRAETDASGARVRWLVKYSEAQEWVRVVDGWRVARVTVTSSNREKAPEPAAVAK